MTAASAMIEFCPTRSALYPALSTICIIAQELNVPKLIIPRYSTNVKIQTVNSEKKTDWRIQGKLG